MGTPKISVIVPVYNVEQYLDRCIESITNQTLKDIEIILVDDKSPDNSPQKCDDWAKRDKRIKVIHKSINEGLGFARNTGLKNAIGEYVTFVDSDDWIDLNMYSDLYLQCKKYNADIIYSGLKRIDDNNNISFLPHIDKFSIYQKNEILSQLMLNIISSAPNSRIERNIQVSVDTCLFRNDIIIKNNIKFHSERELISEDLFFHIDYLPFASIAIISPEIYYYYYYNSQSLTTAFRKDRFVKYKIMYFELLKQIGNGTDVIYRIDRFFIGYCRSLIKSLVASNINWEEKKKLLTEICEDNVWKNISERYPITEMPIIHKIPFKLMLKKQYLLLYILFKLT